MNKTRRAADVIVERLIAHAVRHVFSVAGESYPDVLGALYDARGDMQIVPCRHEAAAANMAEACGKLCGRAGDAFVTRGPGLTHASIDVHTAMQDASPMVLFVGEISREDRHRRAFHEVDLAVTFADLAKGVCRSISQSAWAKSSAARSNWLNPADPALIGLLTSAEDISPGRRLSSLN